MRKSITINSTKEKRNETLQDKENLFLGGKKISNCDSILGRRRAVRWDTKLTQIE